MSVQIYINDTEQSDCSVLARIERLLKTMNTKLDALAAEVKKNKDTAESAIVLINGIAARIEAAGVDQAKLDSLVADMKNEDDALAAAVVANTPADALNTTDTGTPLNSGDPAPGP